jgi:hypothetical protein
MAAGTAGMTEKYMQAMGKDPTSVDWSKFENVKVPDISKISSDLKSSVLDIFDRGGTLDVDSLPVGAIDENIKFAGALPSGGNIATQDLFSLEKVRRAQEIMARRNRKDLYYGEVMRRRPLVDRLKHLGRDGDTEIRNIDGRPAHVNRAEASLYDKLGSNLAAPVIKNIGRGSINPTTGLKEYPIMGLNYDLGGGGGGSDYDPGWGAGEDEGPPGTSTVTGTGNIDENLEYITGLINQLQSGGDDETFQQTGETWQELYEMQEAGTLGPWLQERFELEPGGIVRELDIAPFNIIEDEYGLAMKGFASQEKGYGIDLNKLLLRGKGIQGSFSSDWGEYKAGMEKFHGESGLAKTGGVADYLNSLKDRLLGEYGTKMQTSQWNITDKRQDISDVGLGREGADITRAGSVLTEENAQLLGFWGDVQSALELQL